MPPQTLLLWRQKIGFSGSAINNWGFNELELKVGISSKKYINDELLKITTIKSEKFASADIYYVNLSGRK